MNVFRSTITHSGFRKMGISYSKAVEYSAEGSDFTYTIFSLCETGSSPRKYKFCLCITRGSPLVPGEMIDAIYFTTVDILLQYISDHLYKSTGKVLQDKIYGWYKEQYPECWVVPNN